MKENLTFTSQLVVGGKDTAIEIGSGSLPVLATPRLAALMENAAMLAVSDSLEDGQTTVGGQISITHLRPSAVGAEVRATATLLAAEGKKLSFKIEAYEGEKLIAEGTHIRFIVDVDRFMSKL